MSTKTDVLGNIWLTDGTGRFCRDPQGNRILAPKEPPGPPAPKRIALVGGSFDPPHAGHAALLRWLIKDNPAKLDDIWILPVVNHAFGKDMAPYDDRAALVDAMVGDLRQDPALQIKEVWAKKQDFQPTLQVVRREEVHTVDALTAMHTVDTVFVLVLGEDCIADRHSWSRWEEVEKQAEILVVSRNGCKTVDGFEVHNIGGPEVSSTSIRERLASGDLTYLTGDGADISARVFSQVEKRGLYGYTPKTFPPGQVSLDVITVKRDELLSRFKPTESFSLTGDVRQVLSVAVDRYGENFVCQVLRDTAMEKEHWELVRAWMKKQTASRAQGTDFAEPKPTMKGPTLQYLKQGEPTEGHIAKGTFLGQAGDYAFWQVDPSGLVRSIFGGLF